MLHNQLSVKYKCKRPLVNAIAKTLKEYNVGMVELAGLHFVAHKQPKNVWEFTVGYHPTDSHPMKVLIAEVATKEICETIENELYGDAVYVECKIRWLPFISSIYYNSTSFCIPVFEDAFSCAKVICLSNSTARFRVIVH